MEFRILGPLEVGRAGQAVRLVGARQRRLLAILLLNANSVVPAGWLADHLWDDPPETARQQVHNAVAALRRNLAAAGLGEAIGTTELGYRLTLGDHQLDARAFDSGVRSAEWAASHGRVDEAVRLLREALGLWRGPALAGLGGRLLAGAAARLDEQRLTATERLLALRMSLGENGSVVGELAALVARHPLRESLRGWLMTALYRCGRQADALAVFDEGRRHLAEELGLDPGPALRDLHDRILRGDPDPAAAGQPPWTAATSAGLASTGPASTEPAGTADGIEQVEHIGTAETAGADTEDVPDAADAVPEDGTPPEEPARRCFLPYDNRDFAGRTAEIDVLLAETDRPPGSGPLIAVIDGMGGIGKTTLAVHLAHRLAGDYPDGQYFVDLHGFTPGREPLAPEAALGLLLRDAGVPAERTAPDLEGRAAQWRSQLTGRRVLLLLDNAADEAQVRPLLPGGSDTLVLVTSRRRLVAVEGAIPLSLDVLPHDDAVSLFLRVAGPARAHADPADVSAAVTLCGHLPLAVRIAASRLRHRPSWSVAHLVDLLRDQQRRTRFLSVGDRDLAGALSVSYGYLTAEQRRLFRLLAVHPGGDLDAHAAAALAGTTLADAEHGLEELFECNLLMQHEAGRYHLHDLVRDHAQDILGRHHDAEDRRAARHRLFDYYLHLARTGCGAMARGPFRIDPRVGNVPTVLPPLASEAEAVDRLRAEFGNIVEITRYAAAHGWDEHAWKLPYALQPLVARMHHYPEGSLELFDTALGAARRAGSRVGELAALAAVAIVHREQGRHTEACRLFEQAIALSRQIGDRVSEAYLQADLGAGHVRVGELRQAYECFSAARSLVDPDDRQAVAAFTNNLGVVCVRTGRFTDALRCFERALAGYQESGFRQGEALALVNVGLVRSHQGRLRDAAGHLRRGLHLSRQIGYRVGEGLALAILAEVHRHLGEVAAAVDVGRNALALARQAGLPEVESTALAALGEAYLVGGRTRDAVDAFHEADRVAVGGRLPLVAARAREGLAHARLSTGDVDGARRAWEQALALYPAGAFGAEHVRRHLAALPGTTTCPRCLTGQPRPAGCTGRTGTGALPG